MFCTKCGKEIISKDIFCSYCGREIIRREARENNVTVPNNDNEESITCEIKNIRNSGVASIKYWTILFTEKAVYFLDTGSNSLPFVFGAIEDAVRIAKSSTPQKSLEFQTASAKKFYRISNENLNILSTKKGILGGKVLFSLNGRDIKVSLSGKQFKKFVNNLDTIKGSNK